MFSKKRQWGFDWSELITGIIFLIAAYFVTVAPRLALSSIVIIFAISAIVRGVTTLSSYQAMRETIGQLARVSLVIAILDIVIGFIFLAHIATGVLVLSYLFAFWFLIDSINGLITARHLRLFGTGYYWLSVILDILGIIFAIILVLNPLLSMVSLSFMVSIYFLLFGLNYLMIAFARKQ
ncbi:HdeD family acid-resistance protein [Loigolactobacillus iwatensis]|uniref:HdeD family acid-resistance protein n=1 Tax=Loigolactobacillus iwatensis TaxID=1267156 RepID=UPI000F7FA5F1|nr:DUF308 domain-containing protein [Loigolactobacillus iwatensis]